MNKDSNVAKTKLAAIVGGAGGVGSATAKLLKEQGYRVVILDRENCDVTDESSVSNAFKKIDSEEGAVDIVVYAPSAPVIPKPVFHKHWDDFSKHLDVQAKGLFFVFSALSKSIISGHKIKFTILSPGPINTKLLTNPPLGLKISEPEEIAKIILFLANNESKSLNGANINVNGGST